MKRLLILLAIFTAFLYAGSKDYVITFEQPQKDVLKLKLDLVLYQIGQKTVDGKVYSVIDFNSSVFTRQKGYARLPLASAAVRPPAQKDMAFEITASSFHEISLGHPLLPSRGVIYRNQNPADVPYEIDPASVTDSWYPETIAVNSAPFIIRSVRGSRVEFSPFQYNALQQKLRIYDAITVRLKETDNPPVNPLTREPGQHLLETQGMYNSIFVNSEAESALPVALHGDILVVTTNRDESAIQPYIDWKREKGFKVSKQVVAAGTLVKDLIQQEYDSNPNLLYVQLVGDWADIKSELGTSSNLPMDPDMGCVSGSDNFPDIAIGRISANSAAEVTLQVNKIIDYEKNPATGNNWLTTATGIASDQGPGDDNEKDYEHEDVIWNDKLNPFTYAHYNAIYDPSATSSDVSNAVNSGTGIINYTGHGSSTSWGTTGFSNSDVNNLTNGSLLPIIFSVACNNGEFNLSSDCFAEAWLKKDNGGAVMFLGSTISQPWDPPMRGQDYFNDVLIGGYDYDAHGGQSGINTNEQRTFTGSLVVNGMNLMLSESEGGDDVETVQTWTTFGDPAMQIRTQAPAPLTLSNESVRTGEAFSTTVTSNGTAVSGAMVALSQNGAYFSGITDENGDVTIEQSLTAGTAKLVTTAFNMETIYKDITVSAADGPWIVVESNTIDDGVSGNGNGLAEDAETIYLDVTAANTGNETADDVTAKLRSSDLYLTISDSTHNYGTMAADASVVGDDAFALTVAGFVPDQHASACQVYFSDALDSSWTSNISILLNAPVLGDGELSIDDSAAGNNDGDLDVAETADLHIPTFNEGHASAADVQGTLTSGSGYLTINNGSVALGALNAGDTVSAAFNVTAASDVPAGTSVDVYFTAASGAYTQTDTFTITIGNLPVILMADGSEYISDVLFYDTGGSDGDYSAREKLTMTFYPQNRSVVKAVFRSFNLSDYDALSVYDGEDKNAPQVSGSPFTGTALPPEIKATNSSGALTFYFESNIAYNAPGWEAEVSTDAISRVDKTQRQAIESFALIGNYPNPFNPNTIIKYELPITNEVTLVVYNALGQKVRTLVNKRQESGKYSVSFNASTLSSGIYYYRLSAGSFVQVHKMLLVK